MKSKLRILGQFTRDELADWARFYELEVVDRRVRDQLVEVLAHSKKARLGEILAALSRDRLKEVCRGLGLSDKARAKATLVDRLAGTRPDEAAGAASRVSASERASVGLQESKTLAAHDGDGSKFASDGTPGTTHKIVDDEKKFSQDVAGLVGEVYRALVQKHANRQEDAIRFTLQCIVAMFAEDIGLLPKESFTALLHRAAEKGDAMQRIGALFVAMSTEQSTRCGTPEADIPYFNGGLFTHPVSLELGATPLKALTRAAEANWTFVDPHIFGSVFQGIMGDAERHASGAHYTAREDIMSVVGPTIVEPWRERINAASTLTELQAILADFPSYRVLDPACGSGNFLYVAFRELYKLETEVLCRISEFPSMQSGGRGGIARVCVGDPDDELLRD